MPEATHMSAVREQLKAARRELDVRIGEEVARLNLLEQDLERLDAAIAVLDPGSTEAPASGGWPVRTDAGLPGPEDQAGAGAPVDPGQAPGVERTIDSPPPSAGLSGGSPSPPPRVDGALNTGQPRGCAKPSGVTAEMMLDWMREHADGWIGVGPLARSFGLKNPAVRVRLAVLLERGLIEMKGERAGTRYRLAGVERTDDVPVPLGDGKDDQACASRPVAGSLSPAPEPGEAIEVPVVDRETGQEVACAADDAEAPAAAEMGLVDRALTDKIEGMLARARQPLSARDMARSLVVNIGEVSQQLHIMVKETESGRFPGVHRDPSGGYSLLTEAAP